MSKKQLAEVVIILDTVQTKLQRIEEYVQGFDPTKASINRLKTRQQILEGIRKEFEETQYEYEILDSKKSRKSMATIEHKRWSNGNCRITSTRPNLQSKR
jgi:exonuclease VII small subunit